MTSAFLFHGPGAQLSASSKASELGILIADPFGLEGLKVDEAREIASILKSPPIVGMKSRAVVIVGPMDMANNRASDALLKTIEKFNRDRIWPILWANDVLEVRPTIRSRCITIWCSGGDVFKCPNEEVARDAEKVIRGCISGDTNSIVQALKPHSKSLPLFLDCFAWVASRPDAPEEASKVWASLKSVCKYSNPVPAEVLVAILVCL